MCTSCIGKQKVFWIHRAHQCCKEGKGREGRGREGKGRGKGRGGKARRGREDTLTEKLAVGPSLPKASLPRDNNQFLRSCARLSDANDLSNLPQCLTSITDAALAVAEMTRHQVMAAIYIEDILSMCGVGGWGGRVYLIPQADSICRAIVNLKGAMQMTSCVSESFK